MFGEIEEKLRQRTEGMLPSELSIQRDLLSCYERLQKEIKGTPEQIGYPNWTIMLFVGRNLTIINNSLSMFLEGYLPTMMALVRLVMERVILSMYFAEFPVREVEYRKEGYSSFFNKNGWHDKLIAEIDRTGHLFKNETSHTADPKYWFKSMYKFLMEEASKFLHPTEEYDYTAVVSFRERDNKERTPLIIGPQEYNLPTLKVGLIKLIQPTVWSIMVLNKVFGLNLTTAELSTLDSAVNLVKEINMEKAPEAKIS